MKHLIIGTAGHVDHGKTCLIKALTGIETDRLKEEKKRGITIDLGFAWLDLPNGEKAGIIDVPGHEKFVRNMLAGAGGIDLTLLIVAADEGVMPQTREHLEILKLLNLKNGMIVLTKADLVDDDLLAYAEEDIKEACKGSFLENAEVHVVSSHTGQGIEELRSAIIACLETLPGKDVSRPFREPIDRVFTMEGFGTVITGTLLEGSVHVGDQLMLYPQEEMVRVRSIQVHGHDTDLAVAGQRTAMNLAQISRRELKRGDILAKPYSLDVSNVLDVEVRMLDESPYILKNGSKLHLHHGASETLCRIRLLNTPELKPGEHGFARLHLEESVAVKYGDPYVLRFFSPVETIAGGTILDPCPVTIKIKDEEWEERLGNLLKGSPLERLILAIDAQSPNFMPIDFAMRRSGLTALPDEVQSELLNEALEKGSIKKLSDTLYLSAAFVEKMSKRASTILETFHKKNPLKPGLKREEMRSRLLPDTKLEWTDKLLEFLQETGTLVAENGLIYAPNFKVKLTPEQKKVMSDLEETYLKAGFAPPDTPALLATFNKKLNPELLLSDLIERQVIKRLDANLNLHQRYYDEVKAYVIDTIKQQGSIKLAEVRDHIGSSRKYAVAILEAFDREKLTKMQDDARVLL